MNSLTKVILPLALCSTSFALQIEFGGGLQQEKFRGWIKYKGEKVDLKKDLHIKDKVKGTAFIDIRHKAKLGLLPLPDLKIAYLNVESSGVGTVSKTCTFTFGSITFNVQDKIYSKFRFNQWDLTFYYTPLRKGFLNVSWGLGAKIVNFKGRVTSLTTGQSDSKSAVIPLPYLYVKVGSQFKFLRAYVDGKGVTAGSNKYFYDLAGAVGVGYKFTKTFGISLDAGYCYQKYRVDNVSDVSANSRIKGGFGLVSLNFSF